MEARDAARHGHDTAPISKNYLAPKVHGAEVEKAGFEVKRTGCFESPSCSRVWKAKRTARGQVRSRTQS